MNNVAIKLRKFNRICPITGFKEENIKLGSNVVVQTDRGLEIGQILAYPRGFPRSRSKDVKLKKVVRYATAEDLKKADNLAKLEDQAWPVVSAKLKEHELPLKLVFIEYLLEADRVIIHYKVSPGKKVKSTRDFTKDLSSTFKARVDLRQISPRAEAKMTGGIGPCGKGLCCSTWLEKPKHVTVKMLKKQGVSISPTKTSGVCGRLMCCFAYEEKEEKTTKGKEG